VLLDTDTSVFDKEREWDVSFDLVTVYRPVESVGYNYIRTDGKVLQLVTEIRGTIQEIASGKYDAHVLKLAQEIKKKGEEVWIRQLHEFNFSQDTYPWCIYPYTPVKIETFKSAWRRLVSIYRRVGAPVKFQLCLQGTNPSGDPTPFAAFYPGDSWVDQVGVNLYINPGARMASLKERLDRGIYTSLCALGTTPKPIFIGETSCTDVSNDKTRWLRDAWRDLAAGYPRLTIVNFFLVDKGYPRDWALHGDAQVSAFVKGMRVYKGISRGWWCRGQRRRVKRLMG